MENSLLADVNGEGLINKMHPNGMKAYTMGVPLHLCVLISKCYLQIEEKRYVHVKCKKKKKKQFYNFSI